jgi:hypothetical protein
MLLEKLFVQRQQAQILREQVSYVKTQMSLEEVYVSNYATNYLLDQMSLGEMSFDQMSRERQMSL